MKNRTITDLDRDAADTVRMLQFVELLIPEPAWNKTEQPHHSGKKFVYPEPWNTPAGHTHTRIGQAARDHELNLTLLLWGKATYRGGSDTNTYAAINRLPILITAAVRLDLADHHYVKDAVTDLCRWPTQLRRFLDEDPTDSDPVPWTRAPGNLTCPHCERPLWLKPGWQYAPNAAPVYCRHCHDETGNLYRWESSTWLAVLQHADQ